jgi:hypothetical protein
MWLPGVCRDIGGEFTDRSPGIDSVTNVRVTPSSAVSLPLLVARALPKRWP